MLLKLGKVLHGMQNRKRDERGFTLIELLVVVIIIGILAAIAIPVFLNQREKAQVTTVKSDVRNAVTLNSTAAADNNNGIPPGAYNAGNPITVAGDTFTPSTNVTITVAGTTAATKTITGTHSAITTGSWAYNGATGAYTGTAGSAYAN